MILSALAKKLRLQNARRALILNAPDGYLDTLGVVPEGVEIQHQPGGEFDFAHLFAKDRAELERFIDPVLEAIEYDGILWISYPKGGSGVETAWPVENRQQERRTHHYFISPEQYMEGEKFAERSGYELVGIFHSHPDHPAIPSQHDLDGALPGFVYLILSIRQGATSEQKWWELSLDRSTFSEIVRIALGPN